MRPVGWLAVGLLLVTHTVAVESGGETEEIQVASVPELIAAVIGSNRQHGDLGIVLTEDLDLDPDLLGKTTNLERNCSIRGLSPDVNVLVDFVVPLFKALPAVMVTFSQLTFRFRHMVSLAVMVTGLLDVSNGGTIEFRNTTFEVPTRGLQFLENDLVGEFPAADVEGFTVLPGRRIVVESLILGPVNGRGIKFEGFDPQTTGWPEYVEDTVFRPVQLVRILRRVGSFPNKFRPLRITLNKTLSISQEDVGPLGSVPIRRKVIIRGNGVPGVGLTLADDLANGGLINITDGGVLLLKDLTYDFHRTNVPFATEPLCQSKDCVERATGLPFKHDEESHVCQLYSVNTTLHTSCDYILGVSRWLFLREKSSTAVQVVNEPGIVDVLQLGPGDNKTIELVSLIGSGACVFNTNVTCAPHNIIQHVFGQRAVQNGKEKLTGAVYKESLIERHTMTKSSRVTVGMTVGIAAVALVGAVIIFGVVFWRRRSPDREQQYSSESLSIEQRLAHGGSRSSPTSSSAAHSPESGARGHAVVGYQGTPHERSVSETSGQAEDDWQEWWRGVKGLQGIDDDSVQFMEQIGFGGYGVVYKGLWRGLPVAIKTVMFQDLEGRDSKQRQRAVYEAAISSSVVHRNVVQTYTYFFRRLTPNIEAAVPDVSCVDWKLHIVQEFCQLGSLLRSLERGQFVDLVTRSPNIESIVEVALDVAKGTQHIHQHNIIHGDLTTRNVLLQNDNSGHLGDKCGFVAKISDFGLSVKLDRCQNHISDRRAGTPLYMAPELGMHGRLSKAADVYSFGIILWELFHLSLPAPVSFTKVAACRKGTPRFSRICPMPYALLCSVCLAPHPEDRPNFEQVVDILERQLTMIRSGCFPKRVGVDAFNAEWAKGIVGLRPQEALAFMLCNLPSSKAECELLSTVVEDSVGERGVTVSTAQSSGLSKHDQLMRHSMLSDADTKELFYDHASAGVNIALSDGNGLDEAPRSAEREVTSSPVHGEIQVQIVCNQLTTENASNTRHEGPRNRRHKPLHDGNLASRSFGSSVTVETVESLDDGFMSVGWASSLPEGYVDDGLNPLGLLTCRCAASYSNSARTCEFVPPATSVSRDEDVDDTSRESFSCQHPRRTTGDSDYFSV